MDSPCVEAGVGQPPKPPIGPSKALGCWTAEPRSLAHGCCHTWDGNALKNDEIVVGRVYAGNQELIVDSVGVSIDHLRISTIGNVELFSKHSKMLDNTRFRSWHTNHANQLKSVKQKTNTTNQATSSDCGFEFHQLWPGASSKVDYGKWLPTFTSKNQTPLGKYMKVS